MREPDMDIVICLSAVRDRQKRVMRRKRHAESLFGMGLQ